MRLGPLAQHSVRLTHAARLLCICMGLSWLCAGCTNVQSVGSDVSCADAACHDAGTSVVFPIGDPVLGPNDAHAYARMAQGMIGDWYGVAAGLETIMPFAISFVQGETPGSGTFSVLCPDSQSCGTLGAPQSNGRSTGAFKLVHVTATDEGQGELSWKGLLSLAQSLTFRSLLLQQDARVLSCVIELPFGVVQLVLQRDAWPDAALPRPSGPPPVSVPEDAGLGDTDDGDDAGGEAGAEEAE